MHYLSRASRKRVDPNTQWIPAETVPDLRSNIRFDGPVRRAFLTWARYSDRAHTLAAPIGQNRGAVPASSLVELAGTPTPLAEAA